MFQLSELPFELLLGKILLVFDLSSLLSLASTSRFFANLCSDDTLWRMKLQEDFNFSPNAALSRELGWKVIYKRMWKPKVYVWGAATQGRLGLGLSHRIQSVHAPMKLNIKARIVCLAAGGWSMQALDDRGRIHVWGQLNLGQPWGARMDGFAQPKQEAGTPHRLKVHYPGSGRPVKFQWLSCGRGHSAALDSEGHPWIFTAWGRPILLTAWAFSREMDSSYKIIQVESGWTSVSVLTEGGDVHVYWPLVASSQFDVQRRNDERVLDRVEGSRAPTTAEDEEKVVDCTVLSISSDALVLPPIRHDLPDFEIDLENSVTAFHTTVDFQGNVLQSCQRSEAPEIKLIRIAAGDQFLVGLTNRGHVLSIDLNGGDAGREAEVFPRFRRQWEDGSRLGWVYMPEFSDIRRVKDHPEFAGQTESDMLHSREPPSKMQITHISAHFRTFVAYSNSRDSSLVLLGTRQPHGFGFERSIFPALSNETVTSVALGDWHQIAMTASGKILSWGPCTAGALGLGDPMQLAPGSPGGFANEQELAFARRAPGLVHPPDVQIPAEVEIDRGQRGSPRRFAFGIAASGHHSAALVFDFDEASNVASEPFLHASQSNARP